MKKSIYTSVLALLLGMAGTTVWAQTHVSTADELKAITATTDVVLDNDIDMTGQGWTPLENYAGTFDGGGFTISNLGTALFRSTGDATIKNLTLAKDEDQQVSWYPFSPFVCNARGNTTIENCVNETSIALCNAHSIGGFIGRVDTSGKTINVTGCTNKANIMCMSKWVGGIIGIGNANTVNLTNCMNIAEINGDWDFAIGGLIGQGGNGKYTFLNCGNTGKILCNRDFDSEACALMGRVSGSTIIATNCWNSGLTCQGHRGSDEVVKNYPLTQHGVGTFINCYDVYNGEPAGVTQIAEDDIANGALCYLLNGNQSAITFYQTLGTDEYPVFDATHGQVYQIGSYLCDGVTPKAGEAGYSNVAGTSTVDDHHFVDGLCSVCGAYNPADIVDGVYHIGTAAQLTAFRTKASPSSGALLTADIDMTDQGWVPMMSYAGTFDGGGFTISNLGTALFRSTSDATIRNLTLAKDDAQEVTWYPFSPFICNAQGNTTIENCVNETPIAFCNAHSIGGFIGRVDTGGKTINITGCTNKAEIVCQSKWVGGFIGIGNNNTVNLTNCVNIADITGHWDFAIGGLIGQGGNGTYTFTNCGNAGKVTCYRNFNEACALMGNVSSSTIIATNCWNSGLTCQADHDVDKVINEVVMNYPLTQNGVGTFTNCYDVYNGTVDGVKQIEASDVEGGSLCYRLNRVAGEEIYYQTLGSDEHPVIDATHDAVYPTGNLRCDGMTSVTGEYSNTPFTPTVEDHTFVADSSDPICRFCGLINPGYTVAKEGNAYQIGSADDFLWFVASLKQISADADATLLADIEIDEEAQPFSNISSLASTIDGQGHIISGLVSPLINKTEAGAVIKNLTLQGEMTSTKRHFGAFVNECNGDLTIENCVNEVAISGDKEETGGFVGYINGGQKTVNFIRCTNAADITGAVYVGGLLGFSAHAIQLNFTGCMNTGNITGNGSVGAMAGQLNNYNGGQSTVTNCGNLGAITCTSVGEDRAGTMIGFLWASNTTFTNSWNSGVSFNEYSGSSTGLVSAVGGGGTIVYDNCYDINSEGNGIVMISEDQVPTGELCYWLNGKKFIDAVWFQTIGEDEFPVPDPSHGLVYSKDEEYAFVSDESSYFDFRNYIIDEETLYCEEVIACQDTIDVYKGVVEGMTEIPTLEEFLEAYRTALTTKAAVQESEKAYQAYIDACESIRAELENNTTQNEFRTFLEAYLNKDNLEEPGDYPNGSYGYILETHTLDNAAITAEIDYAKGLMNRTLLDNPEPGSEMTMLLQNTLFANDFENWTTEGKAQLNVDGERSVMSIAQGEKGNFQVSQTVHGMPNGIYEVRVNGMSARSDRNVYTELFTGEVFANGNQNFLMLPSDGMVLEEEAVDGENCYLSDEDESLNDEIYSDDETGESGYVTKSGKGCSYAFNAGRYLNRAAVKVTDGTLTVGVRDHVYKMADNWMPFSNVRIFYLGKDEAEANDYLTDVLEGYAARANDICNLIGDMSDYNNKPNIYSEIRDSLSTALEQSEAATDGEEKMQLIDEFSRLFTSVTNCRKAYITLAATSTDVETIVTSMYNDGTMTKEEYDQIYDEIDDAWEVFDMGTVSAQDALDIAARLMNSLGLPQTDENGIYQIGTQKELACFSYLVNSGERTAKAVLTADIDMENKPFTPIGLFRDNNVEGSGLPQVNFQFQGSFDGQGHVISNLTINDNGYYETGLFSRVSDGAVIKNFGIVNANISSVRSSRVAVLIGWMGVPTIKNVYAAGNFVITAAGNAVDHTTLIAEYWSTREVYNCWTVCDAICGPNGTGNNGYAAVTEDVMKSGELCYRLNEGAGETIYYQTLAMDEYPVLNASHLIVYIDEEGNYTNTDPDGIKAILGDEEQTIIAEGIFDMSGRKVGSAYSDLKNLPKGIYVIGGKKFAIR